MDIPRRGTRPGARVGRAGHSRARTGTASSPSRDAIGEGIARSTTTADDDRRAAGRACGPFRERAPSTSVRPDAINMLNNEERDGGVTDERLGTLSGRRRGSARTRRSGASVERVGAARQQRRKGVPGPRVARISDRLKKRFSRLPRSRTYGRQMTRAVELASSGLFFLRLVEWISSIRNIL